MTITSLKTHDFLGAHLKKNKLLKLKSTEKLNSNFVV
jgi:hypothetical protein